MMKLTVGIDHNQNASGLLITANTLVRFRSDRRWIDLKHFTFAGSPSDSELLAALTSHFQFQDDYIGTGPRRGDVHGPYRLDTITPERYEVIDRAGAIAWLDDFCSLFDSPPVGALADDIDAVVRRRFDAADSLFRLSTVEEAQHDLAWILTEFRELVIIRRESHELSLGSDGY